MSEESGLDIEYFRQRLKEARAEILDANAKGGEGTQAVELDQTRVGRVSRIDAMQAQAMSVAAQCRRQQELDRIDAALKLMEEGEYGYCLECGEKIDAARLEIDPAATHCVQCASKIE